MASVKNMLGAVNLRQSGIFLALVAIVILFQVWTKGLLLSPPNVTNLVLQYSYILVLAIGMLFVIVVGHIDLSVGSVIALVGAIAATLVIKMGQAWWVAVIAGLAVGLLIGLWHGFWVAYVGIPGFIVTLASMLLFRGATFMVLGSISLSPMSNEYKQIATGFLQGLFGTVPIFGKNVDVFTLLVGILAVAGFIFSALRTRAARIQYEQPVEKAGLMVAKFAAIAVAVLFFAFQLSVSRGFPIVLFILAALILLYAYLSQNTVYGRHTYAIGGNIHAARLSGVNVKRTIMLVYVHMGLLSAIAGIIYSSRANGAQPAAGNGIELDAIAACFIGGAAVTGGVGRVVGAIIGGTIMAVMTNGMQLLGVEAPTQQVVKGLVLLLAVAFDLVNKRRAVSKG
ncbi:sugar ABC transporter permease [Tessaracoccus sp. MC1865]|uniref:multiple monosaccharide ABC transporter permease n=1 Tax=Tessaracoccus sp. MC1865 TaxID=2760310 RepID=UPI001602EED6|nr:multiple monosaccharide ABC transporter permease [Tessaracoccus sp. MC1865]MBB1483778.1 sugar ABC transporter permease [Tessaracoccus sp. MC1865]QTO36846.1 sugar ABC transporter permease [Tessaracoccus sp. MC1865]